MPKFAAANVHNRFHHLPYGNAKLQELAKDSMVKQMIRTTPFSSVCLHIICHGLQANCHKHVKEHI